MLFSTVSPAIAAALFRDRADILGRMLAVPAAAAHGVPQGAGPFDDDGCPHEFAGDAGRKPPSHTAHHGNSGHDSHDDSEHAAHGAFCSFCLTAGSTVTLPAPATAAWAVSITTAVRRPVENDRRPAARVNFTRHLRDPPSS
jgi:hypothetical protein